MSSCFLLVIPKYTSLNVFTTSFVKTVVSRLHGGHPKNNTRARDFSHIQNVQPAVGTSTHLVGWYRVYLLGVNRLGRDIDHVTVHGADPPLSTCLHSSCTTAKMGGKRLLRNVGNYIILIYTTSHPRILQYISIFRVVQSPPKFWYLRANLRYFITEDWNLLPHRHR